MECFVLTFDLFLCDFVRCYCVERQLYADGKIIRRKLWKQFIELKLV
jgi:hypothetical protein